jgi:CRP/FNR family transcriptional regulator
MISDTELRDRIHDGFSFLRKAPPEFAQNFFRCATYARLDSGQFVCREGSQCAHLALVLTGSARVFKLGETGREITLYRLEPGQSCILTASCILSELPFPAFAVTETPVEAVVVRPADVRRWILQSPQWRAYIFGLIATRLDDVITVVQEVAFHRMDRRIAAYLLQRTPMEMDAKLRVTHQEIASDLGTSREVVSRILKDLEGANLLAIARGKIRILDRTALEAKSRE